jgi:hypothetical protein
MFSVIMMLMMFGNFVWNQCQAKKFGN